MSANPTSLFAKCLLALCFFVLCSISANAQVEPDTVKRKPALPTGPPGSGQPVYTPTRTQPQQPPKPKPEVVKPVVQEEEKEKEEFIDKLYFGGSLGLQFGTYTNISLLPILGYRITDRLSAGVGAVYHYIKDGPYSMHNYGGRLFAQVEMFDIGDGAILAHAEAENIRREYLRVNSTQTALEKANKNLLLPLVGLGYRQRISEKASFDILVLYNSNNDPVNPYSNPVIRAGVNIPFRK
ncbi:hypothetical protein [Pontibacter burrus]|uniref:Outer membrane protein beta-barrel domain-containing protein n=1 Tax=Pontibacter burrus TaxID=2704466 RepID=A0A6B3LUE9_9BACT|nr:hypothetical protein [Pontibacter burrus]NEM97876.1 hypothetical protein [Pontibacter burrus]